MTDPKALTEVAAGPVLERTFEDVRRGYRGHLVIDSLACGTATGGIRIRPGVTLGEIRDAARVMTWKHRFVGFPNGGAKAGIEGPEDLPREEKARRLEWLAEVNSDLVDSGVYAIAPDMGTDGDLIGELHERRNLLRGKRALSRDFSGSGFYAALSTVTAAEAALATRGETLRGKTVAIEGFGSVGRTAAAQAVARGARLVALSTSAGAIFRADGLDLEAIMGAGEPLAGDRRAGELTREGLLTLDVDVLLPCGPGGTIGSALAAEIAARVVSPGANRAFDLASATVFMQRERIALPCFVANSGGVTGAVLGSGGVPDWAIRRFIERVFRRRVASLLDRAMRRGVPPLELALAELPPLPGASTDGSHPATRGRRLRAARRIARSRLIPGHLSAVPTYLYFRRRARAGSRAQSP